MLNIILDPIFIFSLDMGVKGAALATVLSQMASCTYVLLFLFGQRPPIRITFGGYQLKVVRSVLTVGFTSFLIIAIDNGMIIAMNAVLQRYGGPGQGDILITCCTIMQSFMLMVTMPLGGITGARRASWALTMERGGQTGCSRRKSILSCSASPSLHSCSCLPNWLLTCLF